jgi:hypothetical protein
MLTQKFRPKIDPHINIRISNAALPRIILKFIISIRCCKTLLIFSSLYLLVARSCEHGNEPSGSIKDVEFLDYLSVLLYSQ